jgi:hypothetical protein
MKRSFPLFMAIVCAAGALQAVAATQSPSDMLKETPSLPSDNQHQHFRTADWGFATPQMIPLDRQQVRSWGAAVLPGPRNTHVSPPHGGLVTAGDRSNVPGRE